MYNRIELIGRLGADPETRETTNGKRVTNFRIATDRGFGETKTTDWHRCVAFEKRADVIGTAQKGALVFIAGALTYRDWTDKEGQKKTSTEVLVDEFRFLEKKQHQEQGDYKANLRANDRTASEEIPF